MKKSSEKRRIPLFFTASFLLLIISLTVYILTVRSARFADFINSTVSVSVRIFLSSLTYILPFSLFEILIILSPLILFFTVFFAVKRCKDSAGFLRCVLSVLGVISLIFTSYIYTLGVGYRTTPLADRIGIEDKRNVSADELYATVNKVIDELNILAEDLELSNGESKMPYTLNGLSEELITAYDNMNADYELLYNYPSRVKPVYFSTVMSDLGITGIYSFFTGEANVNVEYPDYCLVYTAAHELAHQRGISRENEANFTAFLVCISSDEAYIRYSGYLNMYEYLSSALYRADKELYASARARLSDVAVADMRKSNEVYNMHKDSILGKINDRLNDAYLKANGTEGVVSYGYVVRLAVSYYQNQE